MKRPNTPSSSPLLANNQLTLAVVYINYCQDAELLTSLESLFKFNQLASIGVVIVDNSPSPISQTKSRAQSICATHGAHFAYIDATTNLGFGKACNLGASIFPSTFLLLLNCDTQFIDDSLLRSISFLNSCVQSVVALGCVHLDNDHRPFFPAYPFLRDTLLNYLLASNPLLYRLFGLRHSFSIPSSPSLVGDISGAFMLLRTSVFSELSGFSPEFFLYSEDTSLCRDKIVPANYSIVFYPAARIIHHVGTPPGYSWRLKQALASEMLRRYRQGFAKLLGFTCISLLNYFTLSLVSVFKADSGSLSTYLRLTRDLFHIFLCELPLFLSTPNQLDFRVACFNGKSASRLS